MLAGRRRHRGGVHRVHDAIGKALSSSAIGIGDQDRKLVTAITRDEVLRAGGVTHDPSPHLKHQVPMLMTELIVHGFEMVEVDEQQRKRSFAPVRARKRAFQAAVELSGVGQACERVCRRLLPLRW